LNDCNDEYGIKKLFDENSKLYKSYVNNDDDDDDDVAIVSLKTSTLILLFSITVIVSMGLGNGCGSYFVFNPESEAKHQDTPDETLIDEHYSKVLIYRNGKVRQLKLTSSLAATTDNGAAILDIIESYKEMETKLKKLEGKYEELRDSYQVQTQTMLQMKRGANSLHQKIPVEEKTPNVKTEKSSESLSEHVHSAWSRLRNSWKTQQQKATTNAKPLQAKVTQFRKIFNIGNVVNSKTNDNIDASEKYCSDDAFEAFQKRWKNQIQFNYLKPDKPTSVKKTTTNKQGKSKEDKYNMADPETNFQHSAKVQTNDCRKTSYGKYKTLYHCDRMKMLEVADVDFPRDLFVMKVNSSDEITMATAQPDCTVCNNQHEGIIVEIINEKIRIVSPYSETDDLHSEGDPFHNVRKNLRELKRKRIAKEEKERCSKTLYGDYNTLYTCPNGKILEKKDPKFKATVEQKKCFACDIEGIYVEIVNKQIRIITQYQGENLTEISYQDPFKEMRYNLFQNETENSENDVLTEQRDLIKWMQHKLAKIELEFDIHKWRVSNQLIERISDLQYQISNLLSEKQEQKQELKRRKLIFSAKVKQIKTNLKREKENILKQKSNSEELIEGQKEEFLKWKLSEERRVKQKTFELHEKTKQNNKKFKLKVEKAKDLLKKNLRKKHKKIEELKTTYEKNHQIVNDGIKLYKQKNMELSEKIKTLRKMYRNAVHKVSHYKSMLRETDVKITNIQSKATETLPKNEYVMREIINKYRAKQRKYISESKWRIPMQHQPSKNILGKPIPPSGLKNPIKPGVKQEESDNQNKEILKPSPSRYTIVEENFVKNENETDDSASSESSWYFYHSEERRKFNSYYNDWYNIWMKSREESRKLYEDDEAPKVNWFLKLMKERENQRCNNEDETHKEANKKENDDARNEDKWTKAWNNVVDEFSDSFYKFKQKFDKKSSYYNKWNSRDDYYHNDDSYYSNDDENIEMN